MNVEYINPFIEATIFVLESISSMKVESKKIYIKEDKAARGDVSSIIGLSGDLEGSISVAFTENIILPLVSEMFGEEMTDLDDEVKDAVGEIANMISGRARQLLEIQGKNLKAAIPTVIMGKNHTISHITDEKILAVPFETEHGEFTIEVCLEG
ncbi:MAG: chemotaxis protein CheX [Desulfobacteraceae bacterium]|jgi:chemotaxis protein CheX